MGTLMGHILPGTFFGIFAIWWGFCLAVRYFYSRHSMKKFRKLQSYRVKTIYPCSCCPSPSLRQIPLESYIKLICISIGILGEAVTGLRHDYNDLLQRKTWSIIEVNTQHITMFFSFGLASFIEILVHGKYGLPQGIEFMANILAFGVEGFLFHFHLHGRDEVDIHVHTLLVYNIAFCILAGIWEFNRPNQILASYARTAATLLQGAWFYAAGFILYFPSSDPYWRWLPGHKSILMITVIFIWLALFICIFLFVQTALIWSILKRRHADLEDYNTLNNLEEEEEEVEQEDDDQVFIESRSKSKTSNNHRLKSMKPANGHKTTTTVQMHQHDEDSDSQIEFDQRQAHSSKI